MPLGDKLKQIRLSKGIAQDRIAEKLGYVSQSYISDAELNRFIPKEDKLKVWAEVLGMSWEEMQDLLLETKLEELGISDPAFTMMFKDFPKMTSEEKKSIIRAYEAVLKARELRARRAREK